MKQTDISDVEECVYKIESLLNEYNCYLHINKELGGKCIIIDKDTNRFEMLPHTSDYIVVEV